MRKNVLLTILLIGCFISSNAQQSVARRWNEVMLKAIRQDQARPPVQARNLYHVSLAMYDAWAVYVDYAKTCMLGKTIGGVLYPFTGIPAVAATDTLAFQETAISYAAYRVLRNRYANSPNAFISLYRFDTLMNNLGYDINETATTYDTGNPAHLGNYIAEKVIELGMNDGCHQATNYNNYFYTTVNSPLFVAQPGNPSMADVNRWQPLYILNALDQNGIPTGSSQTFLAPEWGSGLPFCMPASAAVINTRGPGTYPVYKDPGEPPHLSLTDANDSSSNIFKWGHEMVAIWSSHLDPNDTTMMDASPNAIGNNSWLPSSFTGQQQFYNFFNGGDTGKGYALNPVTGLPYAPNLVNRGDYTRVISQYWADGPTSETPPGHWFVLLNEVSDHPLFEKKYEGTGPVLSNLEWDVKSYLTLGGAMHDAAVACWGIKGWYDTPRPISALRVMAAYGQCSDSTLPHYHPAGLNLIPGYIELVNAGDSLALLDSNNINKIKLKAWRGFTDLQNPNATIQTPTGAGWILAENWLPYQRKTFVTPPFAGYVSGHSTYSRAGATVMTKLTGSAFFPGGLVEHTITPSSDFLVFETGPSSPITMQWATYQDASDQASLSRIWGGIHPPFDDIKGRLIGEEIGNESFAFAKAIFNAAGSLPVSVQYLTSVENNCTVKVAWSSALEENVNRYEIWRSGDGEHYDTKISTVNARGTQSGEQIYSIVDAHPLPVNYYKLVSFDNDQHRYEHQTSFIRLSTCGTQLNDAISFFPNPVTDVLTLNIENADLNETVQIIVTDLTGRNVFQSTQSLQGNQSIIPCNLNYLTEGNYILHVALESRFKSVSKFVKSN